MGCVGAGLGLEGLVGAAGPWPWAGAGGWEAQAAGLLSLSKSLCKTEKNKENEKGKKRKVRERVGHGDNFPGLAKMRLYQEKWSGQDCKN